MAPTRVIVEADGGSRGNPGPAAYGAVLRDADTGAVIADRAEPIGVATNNVAEYRGLIAGLELVREHAPDAEVEVRMDSKLVIEQMAGRWKIKHPDMRPLAIQAKSIEPFGVQWTWVPREQNKAADAILNVALDEAQGKRAKHPSAPSAPAAADDHAGESARTNPLIGWRGRTDGEPTTLILLRHGVTPNTVAKLFCGSGGTDPGLNDDGREQAERATEWLMRRGDIDVLLTSPLRRTRETADIVAKALDLDPRVEDGVAEAAFGEWDGLDFATVQERWPDGVSGWLEDTSIAPPGGESLDEVAVRVRQARDRIVGTYPGKTVVAVSHVTPIKMMVRLALDAPMHVIHRMELAPASLTTIQWWPDGAPSLRAFSYVPE